MTDPKHILIREASNESGYTAHRFPSERAAHIAMECMIRSDIAAIETTYHLRPHVVQLTSYKTQILFNAIISEADTTVKITYGVYEIS